MRTITIVVAMDKNRAIGFGGKLPWQGKLPADMKHFQQLTHGTTVIMGRNTWESLPAKFQPLPDRHNIVLSRKPLFRPGGTRVFPSLDQALAQATTEKVCIIGGESVYREALPLADTLERTLIHHEFTADTFFPQLDLERWLPVSRRDYKPDERNAYSYSFITYLRLPRTI